MSTITESSVKTFNRATMDIHRAEEEIAFIKSQERQELLGKLNAGPEEEKQETQPGFWRFLIQLLGFK